MSTRNVRLRLSVLLDIALAVDTCRPLCCLLHKFRIMKQHLLLKLQLLGVLIAYEYSKCLSPPVSFASHCIGYCCLQATLLSFAQFLFCFACASYKSLKLDLNHYLPTFEDYMCSFAHWTVRLCMLNGIVLLSEKKGKCWLVRVLPILEFHTLQYGE